MPASIAPDDPRLNSFVLGQGDDVVILIHGFTGSPFEMRWLGERLAEGGFRCIGVRLPGHGVVPEELERTNAMDWVNEARSALLALPPGQRAFLVGLSMGALIATILAADHPHLVRGVALCAPALRLRTAAQAFSALAGYGLVPARVRYIRKRESDIVDPEMRAQKPVLPRVPTMSLNQLSRVQMLAEVALPRVAAPAVILFSDKDRVVPPRAAQLVAKRIGSKPARVVRLTRSGHGLTLDLERERVAREIDNFFRGLP